MFWFTKRAAHYSASLFVFCKLAFSNRTMKQVSEESLVNAVNYIHGLDDDGLDNFIEGHALKQPNLIGYVLQAGEEFENETLANYSIYYYSILMRAFEEEGIEFREITVEDIDSFQEPFIMALDEAFKKESEEALFDLVGQPVLQQFLAHDLMGEDENGDTLDDETVNQLFIVLHGAIGLINSIK